MEKRKIFPLQGIEPWPSNPYPIAIPTELSRLYTGRYLLKKTTV
jgi:hypothetical protein